jgi:hypothetical protein
MVNDKKLRRNYYNKVFEEVGNLMSDKKKFYEIVNKNVNEVFENAYLGRLNKIIEKCNEAQSLEKRRMFLRLKKFIIKNRILQFHSD